MKKFFSKNKIFLVAIIMILILFVLDLFGIKIGETVNGISSLGLSALDSALYQFVTMLTVVPPIFLLIGLLDVWVPRETMIKLMGEKSGIIGVIIAFLMGTLTAGPLVAAFPVALVMLKKGAKYSNVLFFLMIWASAKLPILFFQAATMGIKYTIVTNITLIIVYIFGSIIIERLLPKKELEEIYKKAELV